MTLNPLPSGIRDNHRRGAVGDFLKEKIKTGSELSIVSAYFTIYAFEALKNQLWNIRGLNFPIAPIFASGIVIKGIWNEN